MYCRGSRKGSRSIKVFFSRNEKISGKVFWRNVKIQVEYKGSISFRIVSDRKLHKRAGRRKSSAVGNGEVGGVLVFVFLVVVFVFLFDVFVFLFFVFVFYVRDLHLQRETTLRTVAGTSGFKS